MFHIFEKKKEELPDDVTKSAYHAGGRYLPSVTGSESAWMVFKDTTLQQVEEAFQLVNCEDTTIMQGAALTDICSGKKSEPYLMILGEEDGMFYVIGQRILDLAYHLDVLKKVCTGFSEVSLYMSYQEWDRYGFAKMEDGEIVRAYFVDDDRVLSLGDPRPLERELGYQLPPDLDTYKKNQTERTGAFTNPSDEVILKYAAYETGLYLETVTWSSVVAGYSKILEQIE